jgi:hypothetical protein
VIAALAPTRPSRSARLRSKCTMARIAGMNTTKLGHITTVHATVKAHPSQKLEKCVRELRQEQNMSQVEFGERCGFYQT